MQQDSARAHLEPIDCKFPEATFELKLNDELGFQPSNRPDLNAMDLGYFNSRESLQHHGDPKNIHELVEVVGTSFNAFTG